MTMGGLNSLLGMYRHITQDHTEHDDLIDFSSARNIDLYQFLEAHACFNYGDML